MAMKVNKRKTVSCMHTHVTTRDDLEDLLDSIREGADGELEYGSLPLYVTVEMAVDIADCT